MRIIITIDMIIADNEPLTFSNFLFYDTLVKGRKYM